MQIKLQIVCNKDSQDHLQIVPQAHDMINFGLEDNWIDDLTGKSWSQMICGCKYNSTNQGELGPLAKHVLIEPCSDHRNIYRVLQQFKPV